MNGGAKTLADEPLVCLWQHEHEVDITSMVAEVGFNTVWTDDAPYHGQAWEETHMHRALQVPGVRHVVAKLERIQWGQTHEGSVKHAEWVARLALSHEEIVGLYLNDFYDEVEEGYRTMEQWREIIAAAKAVNPDLNIIVPHYPHRGNQERPYDFDHDAVIFNLWHHGDIARAEEHLLQAERQHPNVPIITGLYLNSGSGGGHWLTEQEFKEMLTLFVDHLQAGKTAGIRVFCACQLDRRPEYVGWAREVIQQLPASDSP